MLWDLDIGLSVNNTQIITEVAEKKDNLVCLMTFTAV